MLIKKDNYKESTSITTTIDTNKDILPTSISNPSVLFEEDEPKKEVEKSSRRGFYTHPTSSKSHEKYPPSSARGHSNYE